MHYTNRYTNICRDFNQSQGTTHPADLSYQIVRDYHLRYVTIENSSSNPVVVGVAEYLRGEIPQVLMKLKGGEIKHLGINSQGGKMQFLWILNPFDLSLLGDPTAFRTDSNSFVLREGINKWFVQFYKRPSYYASK